MTLLGACRYGEDLLESAGVPEAGLNAWLLLEYVSGCIRSHYLAYPEEELPKEAEEHYLEVLKRRSERVPLQYITGVQEFMGHRFLVNEQVLIPRQDTEILVEEVLKYLKPGMHFLDLCTGSGCILLSLLLGCPGAVGMGTDLSPGALETAKRNQELLEQEALLQESDLFDQIEGVFDVIVSNPPYIKSGDIPELMEEVRMFEPLSALDGHEDGLYFYRRIVKESPAYLKAGGGLYLEIGYDQGDSVSELLRDRGFCRIEVIKDLAGLDRVVKGIYPGKI
ncbi:peptide chain release factor N(5)-glutamine methyltransferase [bacterium 1XD21-13]|nr:peptide chain release factor N(5)-glutamine methyltransferase [bacterium 1XD21-13]